MMKHVERSDIKLPDPVEFSKTLTEIAAKSQRLVSEFLQRRQEDGTPLVLDPLNVGGAFLQMTGKMLADPTRLWQAQQSLLQDYARLFLDTATRLMGGDMPALVEPDRGDRRFRDPAWDENQLFDFIKQSYLLTARWLQATVNGVEGLDDKAARKVDFYTRQFVDAMAPSNFILTNPEVLRATIESNGENLSRGLEHMLEDLERGKGQIAIKMTDLEAFKVGENIAVTPGAVIYQNDLMQLIQYQPSSAKVRRRPLLIVPPWINKFYILDLRPENSFIRFALSRGYTVFVVSWVNPDAKLAAKGFDDYMEEGILRALDAIEQATGEREVTALGYCIGGTLMAATLGYMAAIGDDRIKAVTYLAAQSDFSEAGELQVFIDEQQLAFLEKLMAEHGYLDGQEMSSTFNMLRANDLIWSFVVNNYLLGREPFPFDLLYWNCDSTRMPAKMHSFYLRNMYQENRLAQPGGISLRGVPIDLGKITVPSYVQSSKEDHIAPFRSVYKSTRLHGGPVRFVLAGSGHVAGVINPPAAKRYQHWVGETPEYPERPEDWLAAATEVPGSWWDDWDRWLSAHSGPKVPARLPGAGKLKPIEAAPGSYVQVRSA